MNSTALTKAHTPYTHICAECTDALYRMAYLALADSDRAEKCVTEILKNGMHKYGTSEDENTVRIRLTSDLYHYIRRRLYFTTPKTDALPSQLRSLNKHERLTAALRFASGLSPSDSADIMGLEIGEYRALINEIMQKPLASQTDTKGAAL